VDTGQVNEKLRLVRVVSILDTTLYDHDARHDVLQLLQHDVLHVYDVHAQCVHDARLSHGCQIHDALQLAYDDELLSRDVPLPSCDVLLLLLTFYFLLFYEGKTPRPFIYLS
jgi:hypothetical protein